MKYESEKYKSRKTVTEMSNYKSSFSQMTNNEDLHLRSVYRLPQMTSQDRLAENDSHRSFSSLSKVMV